jgi:subtilisin family serine protease
MTGRTRLGGTRGLGALLAVAILRAQEPTAPCSDPELADFDGHLPVFVRMADQLFADGGAFPAFCETERDTRRSELRARTLGELRRRADASWRAVEELVDGLAEAGAIDGAQRFWIVNGFACDAEAEAVRRLAAHPAVAFVHRQTQPGRPQHRPRPRPQHWLDERRADQQRALARSAAAAPPAFDPTAVEVPWNLRRIRADRAWAAGVTGEGVVVALLDSGVLVTPPLVDALWRNPGEKLDGEDDDGNGLVDDLFGWDFQGDSSYVLGDGERSHGTMCGGIIAGRPFGEPRTVTGVAPAARLMVLRGMGALRAYEYAASMGADVLSMSYMWIEVELGSFRGVFRTAHEHLAACGVVAVGGAGNFGRSAPPGRQIATPKDIPCVIAAAGILEDGAAPAFSSRGPVRWDGVPFFDDFPAEAPLAKPDVSGCSGGFPVWHWVRGPRGEAVEVRWAGEDGVGLIVGPRGNSFAGPHAAGVAALMLAANPDLPPWRVKELMEASCADLGEPGRDTTYGAGLLQADRAVAAALAARGR